MVRSKLSTKFTLHNWQAFERRFKEHYKKEEGEPFKGNVVQYVTTGVIQRKKLPDVEDVITLIKLGNVSCGDDGAEAILEGWLNDDTNRERGIAGAFCDICKDLCFDIPVHPLVKKQIDNLEDTINQMQNAMEQISELFRQIGSIKDKVKEAKDKADKLGIDNSSQEDKEDELGVNSDSQEDKEDKEDKLGVDNNSQEEK